MQDEFALLRFYSGLRKGTNGKYYPTFKETLSKHQNQESKLCLKEISRLSNHCK